VWVYGRKRHFRNSFIVVVHITLLILLIAHQIKVSEIHRDQGLSSEYNFPGPTKETNCDLCGWRLAGSIDCPWDSSASGFGGESSESIWFTQREDRVYQVARSLSLHRAFIARLRARYQPECASTRFLLGIRFKPDASAIRLIKQGIIPDRVRYRLLDDFFDTLDSSFALPKIDVNCPFTEICDRAQFGWGAAWTAIKTAHRLLFSTRASPATETSKQISLKSAVPTSAKSAYIESASK
jgi:hypothetical protein